MSASIPSMALTRVKGNLQRIFDKNLNDLVRGIRNNRENEAKYIAQCMEEIKQELKQDSMAVKANAIAKLTYLEMLGYDISWAAFNIIEVMSCSKFTFKRAAYLAASQCFNENTDVLMLTTNMIRKDLNSTNMYDAGLSLNGLACFVTTDLARDLANDIVTLLTSSKPYIRKRAVLLLYKVFLRYPDALRPTFPRLKEKLEDPDPGVQSAAVNVICELARKNPKNYLSLAPMFFKLMTSSSNNWMLIKIIKLFGALTPLEPRLGKKLIEPLTNLINSTSAMSLLYECINTVIAVLISVSSGVPGDHTASIQLCVQKLSILIEDSDQNLKYLGLSAMGKILQTHPKAVQTHKDLVMGCLDDKDESIRLRALDLLYGMVSKKNITEIVKKLMEHVENAEGTTYRDELLAKIIQICSHNNYQYVTNFEWYVSVLVELTRVEGTGHGQMIAEQMLDVAVRVNSIRHFAVSQMALLIENAHLLLGGIQRSNVSEVLYAAAWICGEYSEHLRNSQAVLEAMLRTKVTLLPGHIQSIFVQNIEKLYAQIVATLEREEDWDRLESLDNLLVSKLPQFELSENLEVQERACSALCLLREMERLHRQREKVAEDLAHLFEGELNPIAPKAQKKVPIPQGLDLEAWINEPPAEESSESEPEVESMPPPKIFAHSEDHGDEAAAPKRPEPNNEELEKARRAREAEVASNPNYLKNVSSKQRPTDVKLVRDRSMPDVVNIELQTPLEIPGMVGLDKYNEQQEQTLAWKKSRKGKKDKKKKGREASEEETVTVYHEVNRETGEMPEDARSTDEEDNTRGGGPDPYKALDINLDEPLRDDERLPVLHHRVASPPDARPVLPAASPTPPLLPKRGKEKKKKKKEPSETKKTKKGTKKKQVADSEVSIHQDDAALVETTIPESNHVQPELPRDISQSNDLDFWLSDTQPASSTHETASNSTAAVYSSPPQIVQPVPPAAASTKTTKKEGSKKKEKETKKKKRGSRDENTAATALLVKDRSEYEVASGVCTPTLEQGNSTPADTPREQAPSPANALPELVSLRALAENGHIRMAYETQVSLADANQLLVKVIFTNLTDQLISRLEWSVLDSLNAKLVRKDHNTEHGVFLSFQLPGGQTQEGHFMFSVQALNMPQRLRGALSYMLASQQGTTPEKLDFTLRFPCSSFMLPATSSRDAFASLLSSGDLKEKANVKFPCVESFHAVLTKICFYNHFSVVEQVDSTASLYSQTIQAQPVCLLVKQQDGSVTIDGKSSDSQLLHYVLQEVRETVAPSGSS